MPDGVAAVQKNRIGSNFLPGLIQFALGHHPVALHDHGVPFEDDRHLVPTAVAPPSDEQIHGSLASFIQIGLTPAS